jgi:hypothetical protein
MPKFTTGLQKVGLDIVREWDNKGHIIATVDHKLPWHEDFFCAEKEKDATARLFAASPELYEFVIWAVDSDVLRGTGMQAKAEALLAKVDGKA